MALPSESILKREAKPTGSTGGLSALKEQQSPAYFKNQEVWGTF